MPEDIELNVLANLSSALKHAGECVARLHELKRDRTPQKDRDTLYECIRCGWRGRNRRPRAALNQGDAWGCPECEGPIRHAPGWTPVGSGDEGSSNTGEVTDD